MESSGASLNSGNTYYSGISKTQHCHMNEGVSGIRSFPYDCIYILTHKEHICKD